MHGQAAIFTAAGTAITLACLLGVVWLGPAAALLNVMTAVPAVYVSIRMGLRFGLTLVAAVAVFLLLLSTPYTLATYLALFGIGSILLSFFVLVRTPWDRAVLYAVTGALGFTLLLLLLGALTASVSPTVLIERIVLAEAEQTMQIYRQSGMNEQQLEDVGDVVDRLTAFAITGFFGLLAAVLISLQTVTLLILRLLTRTHYSIAGVAFAEWRLPARLVWVLIFAGFTAFGSLPVLSWLGQNLLLALLPLYFLQGMAVINSFLRQRPWPEGIKVLIYLALLVLSPLPLIVIGIGIFDLWIDFRKNRQEKLT